MLFIAISAAAILAAFSASGERSPAKASTRSRVVGAWSAASAAAMKQPAFCCGLRSCSDARLERLSLRSRAYSGSRSFRRSMDMVLSLGGLEDVLALLQLVGLHREGQRLQVGMVLPPRQVHVLRIGRDAVDHRVALVECLVELAEGRDLGRTDEGEILGPEEDDLPLALVGLVGHLLEGGLGIDACHRLEIEGGELVANRQHETRQSHRLERF